jgi:cysteine-rich repeat protein
MRWWALLAVALAGCIEEQLVACPGDVVCPAGTQCDTVHGGCITPEQGSACIGLPDQTACRAGAVIGYCLDQICVDPGCGNYIVDPGELCDDGNRRDGDGCSATCTSREQCGDGAIDPSLGEQCDDGNLQSHDGCDSRCLTETATWSVEPLGPSGPHPHWTTYDPQLGKVVVYADGNVWAWDGTQWTVAAGGGPRITSDYNVLYDTSRSRLVVIAAEPQMGDTVDPNPPRDQIYEWDGTTWTMGTSTGGLPVNVFVAAFDNVRNVIIGFGTDLNGTAMAATYSATTHAWTATSSPSTFNTIANLTMAFDSKRGRAVVVGTLSGSPIVGEWGGASWSVTTTTMVTTGGWSAFYDPSVGKVVAIGTLAPTGQTPVQAWSGTAWTTLSSVDLPRFQPSVAFDEARSVEVVFGSITGYSDAVSEAHGTAWTAIPRTGPPPGVDDACSFDDARGRLVCVGNGKTDGESWTYDGTWSVVGTAGDLVRAVTYDPVRGGIVAITPGRLEVLGDADWQPIPVSNVDDIATALAFDPTTKDLVVAVAGSFTGIPTAVRIDRQNQTQTFPSPSLTSLAFDARNRAIVGTTDVAMLQLSGQIWLPIVGPGQGFIAATNARRGTVELVGAPHDVERVGTDYLDLDPAPYTVIGSAAFSQATGDLYVIGADGTSRFFMRRHWDSATPFEDCAGSADVDGDGLAGCDDPDCWTQCHAACPPLTTCP